MPTLAIQSGVYAFAFILCLLFASLVARLELPQKPALLFFLAIEAFGVLCEWLMIHVGPPTEFFWLSLLMISSFWTAPCLWRIAESVLPSQSSSSSHFSRIRLWEWALIALGALLVIPLALASQVLGPFDVQPRFGHFIHLTMLLCIGLFTLQVSAYSVKTAQAYRGSRRQIMDASASLAHPLLSILQILFAFVLVNLVANLVRTANVWFLGNRSGIAVGAILLEYSVIVSGLVILFHRYFSPPAAKGSDATDRLDTHVEATSVKYAKVTLDNALRHRIQQKLSARDQVLPLVRDNGISLGKFAQALGEKSYYVSQVLNQDMKTNFYQYVTDLRIDEAAQQLVARPEAKILDIAFDIGFNSKSTFNTAFKARKGITPSKYRALKA